MRYNILPWNILIRIFMFNSIHLTVRFLRDMHITNPKRSMFYYTRKIYEMRKPHTSLNHQWLQKGGLFLKMQWLQIRNKTMYTSSIKAFTGWSKANFIWTCNVFCLNNYVGNPISPFQSCLGTSWLINIELTLWSPHISVVWHFRGSPIRLQL